MDFANITATGTRNIWGLDLVRLTQEIWRQLFLQQRDTFTSWQLVNSMYLINSTISIFYLWLGTVPANESCIHTPRICSVIHWKWCRVRLNSPKPAIYRETSDSELQYIPRNMHTVFALLCFVVVIHWLIFPYPSGLLHWHCGNLTIAIKATLMNMDKYFMWIHYERLHNHNKAIWSIHFGWSCVFMHLFLRVVFLHDCPDSSQNVVNDPTKSTDTKWNSYIIQNTHDTHLW